MAYHTAEKDLRGQLLCVCRGVNHFDSARRWPMFDSLADFSARLAGLLELAAKERDRMKSDELAADIRRVLE